MTIDLMPGGGIGIVGVALAHGLTIAVFASATMAISGGHLNPAVTFGTLITGKIDFVNAVGYIISQLAGAIAGALVLLVVFSSGDLSAVSFGTPALGTNALGAQVPVTSGLVMEIILTFFLMFVIFGTAIDKRAPQPSGLLIGLTVTLCILAGGLISGAAMNPARFLGPALVGGHLDHLWLYWVGPVVGASLAALLYHHVLEEN